MIARPRLMVSSFCEFSPSFPFFLQPSQRPFFLRIQQRGILTLWPPPSPLADTPRSSAFSLLLISFVEASLLTKLISLGDTIHFFPVGSPGTLTSCFTPQITFRTCLSSVSPSFPSVTTIRSGLIKTLIAKSQVKSFLQLLLEKPGCHPGRISFCDDPPSA